MIQSLLVFTFIAFLNFHKFSFCSNTLLTKAPPSSSHALVAPIVFRTILRLLDFISLLLPNIYAFIKIGHLYPTHNLNFHISILFFAKECSGT